MEQKCEEPMTEVDLIVLRQNCWQLYGESSLRISIQIGFGSIQRIELDSASCTGCLKKSKKIAICYEWCNIINVIFWDMVQVCKVSIYNMSKLTKVVMTMRKMMGQNGLGW